ncbi:hypothetical protein HX063_14815 [Myroides odoratimimus]|uniref:hypothetical protein n=1 Tax=Myroides odoratimimus TaxID=76832 RepID=UPI002576BDF4|nr:hypothetical protein [Myroides odoratimimus]MDM1496667.1 hypothetical protein [Myroides odoratimimus]
MEIENVLEKIDSAISQLIENDREILERGLNELNLNGHLTKYLTPLFSDFHVDPEYNGDHLKPNDRKALDIASNRLRELGKNTNDLENYSLTPDIIIHRRNTNEFNLVVIEVKKDNNSRQNIEFDLLKLEHLTIDYLGNHYNYKVGISIVFGTGERAGTYKICYFQNGIVKRREDLY